MNDFDYDVKEKKRIARGAFAKKNGSKSKKCTLPGDFLTPAQKAKLSTTKVAVNLKQPMTCEDFAKCPPEIQKEYLEWLRDEFKATSMMISRELFARSDGWLSVYTSSKAPHLRGMFPNTRRPKLTKSERDRWLAFIGKPTLDDGKAFKPYRDDPEPETVPDPEPELVSTTTIPTDPEPGPELVPAPTMPTDLPQLRPDHLSATYTGELYTDDLSAILYRLLKDRPCKSITIDIQF